mmetsp:Transcript_5389/g.13283  ORF Transcript_5389/g.13283 Transcript_5389/m.13283 type:complete len:121 (-) Transcript_5389:554-916(-)
MPIPIAVGGESLSSERLRGPYQGLPFAGLTKERPHQSVTWAVCPQNEWQARTVVSFYDDDSHQSRTKEQQDQQQQQEQQQQQATTTIETTIAARVAATAEPVAASPPPRVQSFFCAAFCR